MEGRTDGRRLLLLVNVVEKARIDLPPSTPSGTSLILFFFDDRYRIALCVPSLFNHLFAI